MVWSDPALSLITESQPGSKRSARGFLGHILRPWIRTVFYLFTYLKAKRLSPEPHRRVSGNRRFLCAIMPPDFELQPGQKNISLGNRPFFDLNGITNSVHIPLNSPEKAGFSGGCEAAAKPEPVSHLWTRIIRLNACYLDTNRATMLATAIQSIPTRTVTRQPAACFSGPSSIW